MISTEQHQAHGGLGGAIAETLSEQYPTPMKIMGINDRFGESARTIEELLIQYELTAEHIVVAAQKLIEKTRN
jgi:transketolase